MRRSKLKSTRRNGNRGLTVLTVICAGGLAALLVGWNASQVADLSPSEVIALRFPDSRNDIWSDMAEARAEARTEAIQSDQSDLQTLALFNPNPTIPLQPATPVAATYVTASIASTPVDLAPQPAKQAHDIRTKPEPKIAAVQAKPAAAARVTRRPGAVLSDGQIASIKTRLNLTPDQQQMWPAVEHALRNLSYASKPDHGDRSGTRIAAVDPKSDDVQRLKSAAFPLIMSFNDEQKRELRILAHVAGLEKIAAQF